MFVPSLVKDLYGEIKGINKENETSSYAFRLQLVPFVSWLVKINVYFLPLENPHHACMVLMVKLAWSAACFKLECLNYVSLLPEKPRRG